MLEAVNETPAPTQRFLCEKTNCTKVYKNWLSLLNHIKTNHKDSEEVNSPLGNFLSSNGDISLPPVTITVPD